MARTTHLNALQALDVATRTGSLQDAAKELGITPAAVGQRIRALEHFLDTDLLVRGRSGLRATPALEAAMEDLRLGFAALERVTQTLDFQRTAEVHIVADPDWADHWLLPRLADFRAQFPNILFNVNGQGDVPVRLGAADLFIDRDADGTAAGGEELYREYFLPIGSQETAARMGQPVATRAGEDLPRYFPAAALNDTASVWHHSQSGSLEGFPLLHSQPRPTLPDTPGWRDWLGAFPYQRTAPERGVRYSRIGNAIDAVRSDAGFLICGLSLVLQEIDAQTVQLPFPGRDSLPASAPYRVRLRQAGIPRPQVSRFLDWLRAEAATTKDQIAAIVAA